MRANQRILRGDVNPASPSLLFLPWTASSRGHWRRHWFAATWLSTAEWLHSRSLRHSPGTPLAYLVRDNDRSNGRSSRAAERDHLTAPRSLRQNTYVERLI